MSLIITLLYIVFVLAAIVLIVVILLQEGRGGGFGEALGSGGRETFGVGARGINTFTAVTAGVFLSSALLIHILNRLQGESSVTDTAGSSVLDQSQIPAPPAGPPQNK
jgi:preprotein translocase subunit SecG